MVVEKEEEKEEEEDGSGAYFDDDEDADAGAGAGVEEQKEGDDDDHDHDDASVYASHAQVHMATDPSHKTDCCYVCNHIDRRIFPHGGISKNPSSQFCEVKIRTPNTNF